MTPPALAAFGHMISSLSEHHHPYWFHTHLMHRGIVRFMRQSASWSGGQWRTIRGGWDHSDNRNRS